MQQGGNKVKREIGLGLVVLLLVGASIVSAQGTAEAVLSFEPQASLVEVGDAFDVEVWVSLGAELTANAVDVTFTWEPNYLAVTGITPALPVVPENTIGTGTARLQSVVLGAENAKSGNFLLCTVHINAQQAILSTPLTMTGVQVLMDDAQQLTTAQEMGTVQIVNPPAFVSIDFPLPFTIPYSLGDVTYYAEEIVLTTVLPESGPITVTITADTVTVDGGAVSVEYR